MIIFFDVETTGLSRQSDRIVQIAWSVTDQSGRVVDENCYVIRPDGFEIPVQAARIHGISTERALREGKPAEVVMHAFCRDFRNVSVAVAHNISFDAAFVTNECGRLGLDLSLADKHQVCTMKLTTEWCRLPKPSGARGYKWPRLEELHHRLFGESFVGAHNALADVRATRRCYSKLVASNLISVPIQH